MRSTALRPLKLTSFATLSLMPVVLLLCAANFGVVWLWAALIYMTILSLSLDQILPFVSDQPLEDTEFPASDILLIIIAVSSVFVMCSFAYIAGHKGALNLWQKLALGLASGLWLGQVAHPAAHELIHRPKRGLFRLGALFYAMVFFGQHTSAHRLVHHIHVATPQDPNSARAGESFYRFYPRAWIGSFRKGLAAETALRKRSSKASLHPYLSNLILALCALGCAYLLGGPWGIIAWVALALHVQLQILVSDYVQHYGLSRRKLANGKYEPVGAAHAWNSAHWFSSGMMLNATRHSDHHSHPNRPYPQLTLPQSAPRLPWPLPLACTIAFFPMIWRRRMARRLDHLPPFSVSEQKDA